MKYLYLLPLLSIGCISPVEDQLPAPGTTETTRENSNYTGVNGGNDCPPPFKVIVVINGKPTDQLVIPPCYSKSSAQQNPTSDPPGWGSDNDNSFWLPEEIPNLKPGKPGDPIPH